MLLEQNSLLRNSLFYFAITCWVLGVTVHLIALIGSYDISQKIPLIWLLHIGIFIAWIPAILILKNNQELKNTPRPGSFDFKGQLHLIKKILNQTPSWLMIIAAIGFIYAFINFALFLTSQTGTPEIRDGNYILQSHGKLIKELNENEYNHYRANEIRGFSGHWIAFYGMAAAILFPYKKVKEELK